METLLDLTLQARVCLSELVTLRPELLYLPLLEGTVSVEDIEDVEELLTDLCTASMICLNMNSIGRPAVGCAAGCAMVGVEG